MFTARYGLGIYLYIRSTGLQRVSVRVLFTAQIPYTGHLNLRFTKYQLVTCALISGSRGGDYQVYCLPEYDAV